MNLKHSFEKVKKSVVERMWMNSIDIFRDLR